MFHAILERKNHVANHPYDCQFPLFVPVTKRQQKEKKKKKKFIYLSFKVSEINGHILKKNMLHMRPLLYNANGISPKRRKEISKDSSAECGFSWTGALTCELGRKYTNANRPTRIIRGRVHPVGIEKDQKRKKKESYILSSLFAFMEQP